MTAITSLISRADFCAGCISLVIRSSFILRNGDEISSQF